MIEPGEPLTERELIDLIVLSNDCLRAYEGINLLYHMDDHPTEREVLEKILCDAGGLNGTWNTPN